MAFARATTSTPMGVPATRNERSPRVQRVDGAVGAAVAGRGLDQIVDDGVAVGDVAVGEDRQEPLVRIGGASGPELENPERVLGRRGGVREPARPRQRERLVRALATGVHAAADGVDAREDPQVRRDHPGLAGLARHHHALGRRLLAGVVARRGDLPARARHQRHGQRADRAVRAGEPLALGHQLVRRGRLACVGRGPGGVHEHERVLGIGRQLRGPPERREGRVEVLVRERGEALRRRVARPVAVRDGLDRVDQPLELREALVVPSLQARVDRPDGRVERGARRGHAA
jgi:hypothetical protein